MGERKVVPARGGTSLSGRGFAQFNLLAHLKRDWTNDKSMMVVLCNNALQVKLFHLGEKLVKTLDVLKEGGTLHPAGKLLQLGKQLNSFRKSPKLIRFTRCLPPQPYIKRKDC